MASINSSRGSRSACGTERLYVSHAQLSGARRSCSLSASEPPVVPVAVPWGGTTIPRFERCVGWIPYQHAIACLHVGPSSLATIIQVLQPQAHPPLALRAPRRPCKLFVCRLPVMTTGSEVPSLALPQQMSAAQIFPELAQRQQASAEVRAPADARATLVQQESIAKGGLVSQLSQQMDDMTKTHQAERLKAKKEKEKVESYANVKSVGVGTFSLGAPREMIAAVQKTSCALDAGNTWPCSQKDVSLAAPASLVDSLLYCATAGVFSQNLVTLLKLPGGRPVARNLLIVNLIFSGMGIAIISFLATTNWDSLHQAIGSSKRAKHEMPATDRAVRDQTHEHNVEGGPRSKDSPPTKQKAATVKYLERAEEACDVVRSGAAMQVLNYLTALCGLVVTITSSALGSFVVSEGQ
jgi:hypothetical protein